MDAIIDRPHPPSWYCWIALIFLSLTMFGIEYVYDIISPLADILKQQLGFTDVNIGLLQGMYSLPNIATVFFGGMIIDRIGIKKSIFIFGLLCFVGSVITAVAPILWVMSIGRMIFGMAESLIVAVTVALAIWFREKDLSFASGINFLITKAGSFAALNSPTWAPWSFVNWRTPLLITIAVCSLCVIGAMIYWRIENIVEKKYSLGKPSIDKIVFRDMLKFDISYWYIVGLCVVFYSIIFSFQTFAIKFFMETHNVSRKEAGFLSSMLVIFAIVTPLFGKMVDKVGKRATFMMIGSLIIIPVYILMIYTNIALYIPMLIMSLAYSLIAAVIWPSVVYIVNQSKLGTAYGLMTMIQQTGIFGFNILIGYANDYSMASSGNPDGYALSMWILSFMSLFGFLFAFLLRKKENGPHGLENIKL